MAPVNGTLVVEENRPSGRTAIIADEGDSVWLYLTEPRKDAIAADCWLFNLGRPMSQADLESRFAAYRARAAPPPAPLEVLLPEAIRPPVPDHPRLWVQWSADGEAVAACADDVVLGFIAPGERRGYSRYLSRAGPWGIPFDGELCRRLIPGLAS